jgi:hypothetical protein
MSRFLKISAVALMALVFIVPAASAYPRVFVGGYFGPAYYGPGWYGPAYVGPYGYERIPAAGSVKIETKMKDASVYVDGGLAGTVGQLKTFHLRAGAHDIELRTHEGNTFYQEHIEVVPGKTLKITP